MGVKFSRDKKITLKKNLMIKVSLLETSISHKPNFNIVRVMNQA